MRLVSYYKTRNEAGTFAKDLRLQGAKGVVIGIRGSRGYPVYSTLLDEKAFGNFPLFGRKILIGGRM